MDSRSRLSFLQCHACHVCPCMLYTNLYGPLLCTCLPSKDRHTHTHTHIFCFAYTYSLLSLDQEPCQPSNLCTPSCIPSDDSVRLVPSCTPSYKPLLIFSLICLTLTSGSVKHLPVCAPCIADTPWLLFEKEGSKKTRQTCMSDLIGQAVPGPPVPVSRPQEDLPSLSSPWRRQETSPTLAGL